MELNDLPGMIDRETLTERDVVLDEITEDNGTLMLVAHALREELGIRSAMMFTADGDEERAVRAAVCDAPDEHAALHAVFSMEARLVVLDPPLAKPQLLTYVRTLLLGIQLGRTDAETRAMLSVLVNAARDRAN